jgi:hypothetical protein
MTDEKATAAALADIDVSTDFKITLEGKRVMLLVAPAVEGAPSVTPEEIVDSCERRGYRQVDLNAVKAAIEARGMPTMIAEYEARAATADVVVSSDGMKATIRLSPPEIGGRLLSLDDLKAQVRAAGIIFGVNESVIAALAAEPVYEKEIEIATGRPVEDGQDAEFLYHFETEKHAAPMVADEQGKIDYKELNLIENVVEGQLLVSKNNATPGSPGVTVKNEYIAAKPGKDKPLPLGKNVKAAPDGMEGHAECNGAALLLAGKVTVSQIYQIKGSVGPATGNINFLGSVVITDSVEDGYSVKATESVDVGKTAGKGSLIEAGHDVTVKGGVIEAKIVSGNDIRAKFVQEATLDARNDIVINEAIMHSHVEAGGQVIVGLGGRKGTLVGGQIRAYRLVACKVLGSPMSTKTSVDVGVNPKLLARMEELQTALVKDKTNFENIKKGLVALTALKEKLGGELPPDKEKMFSTIQLAAESLKSKLQEMALELRDLQTQAAVKVHASVSVSDELYPGVKIGIGSAVLYTTQQEKFVTYKEDGGEVRMHTYEAPKLKGDRSKK